MTEAERLEQVETCCRRIWGVMLFADSLINDPVVKAAFRKVDQECRKTGMMEMGGFAVIEQRSEG